MLCMTFHVILEVLLKYILCILQSYSLLYFCLLVCRGHFQTAADNQLAVGYVVFDLGFIPNMVCTSGRKNFLSVLTAKSNQLTMQRNRFAI